VDHVTVYCWVQGSPRSSSRLRDRAGTRLAALGVTHVQTAVPGVSDIKPPEVFAEQIIPAAANL
jgi:hypothetical protein